MTIDDLLAAAETIRNENAVGRNTSIRVGTLFANLINYLATNLSPETEKLINEVVKKYTSGVRKGMTVEWDLNLGPIPVGFVLSNGNFGVKINGVTVPDKRDKFSIGYNPAKTALPANVDDLTENYGAVGNTGGKPFYKLTGSQSGLQDHEHIIDDIESDNSGSTKNALKVENTNHINTSLVKTAKSGEKDAIVPHENRPLYIVTCYITKVTEDYTAEYNSAYHSYLDTTEDDPKLTEAEWVISQKGADGKSAYQAAVDGGYIGTEDQFNIDLKELHNKVSKNGTDRLITLDEITLFSSKQNALGFTPEEAGVAARLVTDLKNGVSSAGDTLKKLYDLIVSAYKESTVANLAERDAYNVDSLPTNVFVVNDGDGKWALYKAISTGVGANYVKISDPDLLNQVMTASQIASSYESVAGVNRFTNELKFKLESFTANFTSELKTAYDAAVVHINDEVKHITTAERNKWNSAYQWGDHAQAGYLKSYVETDPVFTAWDKKTGISIEKSQVSDFPTLLTQFTNNLGNYGNWVVNTDSRLSDARVASDVYSWAKQAFKPGYVWTEIGSRPTALSQFSNDLGNYGGFATHRGEGTNYIDNSYRLYDNYRGGWRTSDDLYVAYAYNSDHAYHSTSLKANYIGGQQLNPQTYFNFGIGLKVAMTAFPQVWADTLWVNGYEGDDVPNMCALHFLRNGQPRMYISSQSSRATSYGTSYEIISTWNASNQTIGYANHLTRQNMGTPDQTGFNGIYYCNGGTTPSPSGSADGTLIASSYYAGADTWGSQIYQDYRAGYLYVRGRNNGSWSGWLRVIDSNNIGSQSVNYATTANRLNGSAHTNGSDGWWRSDGATGWYNESYGVGIYAKESGNVRTYNGANFISEGNITSSGDLTVGGNVYINNNFGRTLVGVYTSDRLQGIFAMGDSYKLPADGTSSGNHYGLAWSHPNAGGQAANLSSHGLLVMQAGTTMAAISTNIWCSGQFNGNGGGLTGTAAGLRVGSSNYSDFIYPVGSINSRNGYGIQSFYSWNNEGTGYCNGITIGSHPGDQSYGWQIYQRMWDETIYFRRYNGGYGSEYKLWSNANFDPASKSDSGHTHDYATHRGEGTNYIDYARLVYNNGAYSGSGWCEPSDLGVRYAGTAGYASSAGTAGSATTATNANYATSAGDAATVGGYSASTLISNSSTGAKLNARYLYNLTASTTLDNTNFIITVNNCSAGFTVHLPPSPERGMMILIKIMTGSIVLTGNGKTIFSSVTHTQIGIGAAYLHVLLWDGTYWQYNKMGT